MNNSLNKNKLSIVIPLLGVTRGGGIRVIAELANGLTQKGHEVILVCPPIDCFPFPLDPNVSIVSRKRGDKESSFIARSKDFLFVFKSTQKLGRLVLSNYYTTFFIGWTLQKLYGKRHVYFIQGYEAEFFDTKQSLSNKIKTGIAKLSYKLKPHLRITISQFVKNKIGKGDTVIINDGIDPKIFSPPISSEGIKDKRVIGAIAMPEVRKGFYDFLNAIQILNEKRSDFEVLLFSSQRNAQFLVEVPYKIICPANDDELVTCMQNSDIFVSSSHLEGFGLPGLEAMACGAALITTNSGGITEYAIDGINSLIVPVGDSKAIASAIEKLLDDDVLYHQIKEEGVVQSKNFTWEIMSENFERELLKL